MGILHQAIAVDRSPDPTNKRYVNGTEMRLLSSREAAEMLRVAEGTLRYWRCVHIGPPWIKLGRRVVYDIADLVEFIAKGRRNPSVRTMEVDDVSL